MIRKLMLEKTIPVVLYDIVIFNKFWFCFGLTLSFTDFHRSQEKINNIWVLNLIDVDSIYHLICIRLIVAAEKQVVHKKFPVNLIHQF